MNKKMKCVIRYSNDDGKETDAVVYDTEVAKDYATRLVKAGKSVDVHFYPQLPEMEGAAMKHLVIYDNDDGTETRAICESYDTAKDYARRLIDAGKTPAITLYKENEGKKMTNKEKFADELLALIVDNARDKCMKLFKAAFGKNCDGVKCDDCAFYDFESFLPWLNEEYTEPEPELLENGDGLKPGDWIMVRDAEMEGWYERLFVCYFDGKFWTVPDKGYLGYENTTITGWKQARLPEDGE